MTDGTPKTQDPHLHDAVTGTENGVPAGAAQEESKGVPDSGRHTSEAAPAHGEAGVDQASHS